MKYVSDELLYAIAPKYSGTKNKRQIEIISYIGDAFENIARQYDIISKNQLNHFLAQVAHECAGFCTTEEFASGEAYEGRKDLGNTEPGDGKKYKGRGLIQLTGRYNYRKFGKIMNLPLEEEPEIAAEPLTSLHIACAYWQDRNLNKYADVDDIQSITRKINGGLNGFDDRKRYYIKIKNLFDGIDNINSITLRLNDEGFFVSYLQRHLNRKGFELSTDGDFGQKTKNAVISFQQKNHLVDDGIVGKNTWTVLLS